jgi:hypothetical protein
MVTQLFTMQSIGCGKASTPHPISLPLQFHFLGPQKQHLCGRHFNTDKDVQKIQRTSQAITNNPECTLDDMDTPIAEYDKGLNR